MAYHASSEQAPRIPTQAAPFAAALPAGKANPPPGTFPPGTLITVGQHKVTIERYLSEGTFAVVLTFALLADLTQAALPMSTLSGWTGPLTVPTWLS